MPTFGGLRGRLLALAETLDGHVSAPVVSDLVTTADVVGGLTGEAEPALRSVVLSQGLTLLDGLEQPEDVFLVVWQQPDDDHPEYDPWPWLLRQDHPAGFAVGSRQGVVLAYGPRAVLPWERDQMRRVRSLADYCRLTAELEAVAAGLAWRAQVGRSGVAEARRLIAAKDQALGLADAYAAAAGDAANAYLASLTLLANRISRERAPAPAVRPVRLRTP